MMTPDAPESTVPDEAMETRQLSRHVPSSGPASGRLSQLSSAIVGLQTSRRVVTREELVERGVPQPDAERQVVQQNIAQTFQRHFAVSIALFGCLFMLLLVVQAVLFLWLAVSYLLERCDGPVRTWALGLFWLHLFNGAISSKQGCQSCIRRLICCFTQDDDADEPRAVPMRIHVFDIFTRFFVPLIWNILGISSIMADTTSDPSCRDTAANFYLAAKVYSIFVIVSTIVALIGMIGLFTVLRYAMHHGLLKTQRAADPKVVEKCQVVALSDMDLQQHPSCAVCLEDYCSKKTIVSTSCGHCFHKQCLKNWLQVEKTCPLCRIDLETTAQGSSA